MKIEHIAIWVKDLEKMKHFYERYFGAVAGAPYFNPKKKFRSYFLSFADGCRLELMHRPEIPDRVGEAADQHIGFIHFAVSVGSEEQVNAMTWQFRKDGYPVLDGPRRTGDGYYESVILDPEGNRIEITV